MFIDDHEDCPDEDMPFKDQDQSDSETDNDNSPPKLDRLYMLLHKSSLIPKTIKIDCNVFWHLQVKLTTILH